MSVMLVTSSVTTAHPVDVQWTAVDMVHVVQAWNASVQTDGKEMIALRKIVVVSLVVVVVVVCCGGGGFGRSERGRSVLFFLVVALCLDDDWLMWLCLMLLCLFSSPLPSPLPSSSSPSVSDQGCENGDCVFSASENKQVCVCEDGWRGLSCDLRVCDPPCGPYGDCGNDATCICDPSWEGSLCDVPMCPHNCGGTHQGHCVSHSHGLSHTCACEETYQSPYCLHRECPKSPEGHVCSARGVCQDGVCLCEPGRSGKICESSTCPSTPVDVVENAKEKRWVGC